MSHIRQARVRGHHKQYRDVGRRQRNQAGSVLLVTAMTLPVLIGFMGLAIDLGALYHHKRRMQTATDAGALAGAFEKWRGNDSQIEPSARGGAAENGFGHGGNGVVVTVNHPPVDGFYVGDSDYVEVITNQDHPTYFMRIFGLQSSAIAARAVAGGGANSSNCVYVLDPTMEGAFLATSSAQLNASCGIMVNSTHPAAMSLHSSTVITAGDIAITGDYELNSSAVVSPTPYTDSPPSPDPLAYLPPPLYGSCTETNFQRDSGTHVLSPGVYCGGIFLENNAQAILGPGMYVLLGGGLRLVGNTIIEGTGVTFYNTEGAGYSYQPLVMESNSQARLAAPTTGDYAGILFWQDRYAGNPSDSNRLQSSVAVSLEGALYFPTQELFLESSTTADALYTLVVARRLRLDSSSNFTLPNDFSGLPGGSPIKRVSLVE